MCTHLHFASTFMTFMTSWPHDLMTSKRQTNTPCFLQTINQANHLITNDLQLTLTSCRCRFCKQIPPISLDLRPKCCVFASWKGYHSHDWINETHNLQLQPENHQPQPLTIKIFTHYGNQCKSNRTQRIFREEQGEVGLCDDARNLQHARGHRHRPRRELHRRTLTGPATLRSQPSETALQGCHPSARPPPLPTWSGGGFSMGQKISQSLVETIFWWHRDSLYNYIMLLKSRQ